MTLNEVITKLHEQELDIAVLKTESARMKDDIVDVKAKLSAIDTKIDKVNTNVNNKMNSATISAIGLLLTILGVFVYDKIFM